jgi:hypothetical protein
MHPLALSPGLTSLEGLAAAAAQNGEVTASNVGNNGQHNCAAVNGTVNAATATKAALAHSDVLDDKKRKWVGEGSGPAGGAPKRAALPSVEMPAHAHNA